MAKLEDKNLEIAAGTSVQQQRAAALGYEKAKESYTYYQNLYDDQVQLNTAGATSNQQLDNIKLSLDIAQRERDQAFAVYQQAVLQSEYNSNNIEDSILVSDMHGIVLDVLFKKGEVVAPGHPVVIVRSEDHIVTVGMTSEDLKTITSEQEVMIYTSNGSEYRGQVRTLHTIPDEGTRTYSVDIVVDGTKDMLVGEVVTAVFEHDQVKGVWLPITDVLNDGKDYVYVVENSRAVRKDLVLTDLYNEFVRVEGLEAESVLVVKGANTLSDGYLVSIKGEDDE